MSKRKLDMSNVETYTKMSEGIHRVKIVACEDKTTQAGDDMIMMTFEAVNGADKGCRVFDNFVLTDKALWKLKQLLQALGVKCDGKIVLDTDKLIGKQCDAEVFHEEYNGQTRAKVNEYTKISAATADDNEDDDDYPFEGDDSEDAEEEPKKAKKKPVSKKTPEPEDDDWDEDDSEDEEEPEPVPKKKAKKSELPKKAKKKPEPEELEDDDDEDWEEA